VFAGIPGLFVILQVVCQSHAKTLLTRYIGVLAIVAKTLLKQISELTDCVDIIGESGNLGVYGLDTDSANLPVSGIELGS